MQKSHDKLLSDLECFFSGPNLAWDKVLTQSFQTTKAKYARKRRKERNRVKGKHRVSQVTTGYNCCCSAANTVLELCGIMKMIRYVKWMHSIISSKYTHIHIIARTSWQDPKKRENIFSIIISGQFGIGMFWLDNWLLTTDNLTLPLISCVFTITFDMDTFPWPKIKKRIIVNGTQKPILLYMC